MGFAIIQVNNLNPKGKVIWMQKGGIPSNAKLDSGEEKFVLIPDSIVPENIPISDTGVRYFNVSIEEIENVACDPFDSKALENFLVEMHKDPGNIRIVLAVQTALITGNFEPLAAAIEERLSSTDALVSQQLSEQISQYKIPIDIESGKAYFASSKRRKSQSDKNEDID